MSIAFPNPSGKRYYGTGLPQYIIVPRPDPKQVDATIENVQNTVSNCGAFCDKNGPAGAVLMGSLVVGFGSLIWLVSCVSGENCPEWQKVTGIVLTVLSFFSCCISCCIVVHK